MGLAEMFDGGGRMKQLSFFDIMPDYEPEVGDEITDKEGTVGVITDIKNDYVLGWFPEENKRTLTPLKFFRFWYKITKRANNG